MYLSNNSDVITLGEMDLNGLTEITLEHYIRLMSFIAVLAVMLFWEQYASKRPLVYSKSIRHLSNYGVMIIGVVLARVLMPVFPVAIAIYANQANQGLLNFLNSPFWLAFLLSFLFLDLLIYFQHRLFHRIPVFWAIHRMHHSDTELDVSSGIRFHPLEIVVSLMIKVGAIYSLGAPPIAVMTFEVVLTAASLFNHANIHIPRHIDRLLRCVLVTPDMHRVHHSIIPDEYDKNFGFNISWWDWIFRTYQDQPREGHLGMVIGLRNFRNNREMRLDSLLLQPFLSQRE